MLDFSRWLAPSHRAPRRPLGLAVMLGLVFLVFGCGGSGASRTSHGGPEKSDAYPEGKRTRSAHATQPERASYEAGIARKDSRRTGPPTATRPTPNPPSRGPRGIPGMNADAVAEIFLKPGLECSQPVDKGTLYACTSEDNPSLSLLYEGNIAGRSADQVSGVHARVFRRVPGDFGVASQPFFGLLATQLQYSGADRKKAYKFLTRNLDSKQTTITIGAAKWTITTSKDRKALTVAPTD